MVRFRKNAKKSMDSPRALNNLAKVLTPTGWLTLLSISALMLIFFIWAFFGNVSSIVSGDGILVNSGNMITISAPSDGVINSIDVFEGQSVHRGQIIGRVFQTRTENNFLQWQKELQTSLSEQEYRLKSNQIDSVSQELRRTSLIVAPADGVIVGVEKSLGENVKSGEPLVLMQAGGVNSQLMAMAFFAGGASKRIAEGTEVRIALDDVRSDEYGYLIGKIVSLSPYPVNGSLLADKLGNADYAKAIVAKAGGVVYLARIQLVADEGTVSGYLWTSKNGPPKEISAGSTFTAACIVQKKLPISYASNWIKTLLEGK